MPCASCFCIRAFYFLILLVQCYVLINNFVQCAVISAVNLSYNSSNLTTKGSVAKEAFIEIFPPMLDYDWSINQLSKTFLINQFIPDENISDVETTMYNLEQSDLDALTEHVKVLCMVLTCPKNHDRRAIHVKNTWGKRCNKLLFMSSTLDDTLPTIEIVIDIDESWSVWDKTKKAFRYIHDHHLEDADWFVKADDDTYLIMENLRYLLLQYDTNKPYYFGWPQTNFGAQAFFTYMNGGAGYVLSREALRLLNSGLERENICNTGLEGAEDLEIGRCLHNLGISPTDSRDSKHYNRFNPIPPRFVFFPNKNGSTRKTSATPYKGVSETVISFHGMLPQQMYAMDYMTYRLGYSCKWQKRYQDKEYSEEYPELSIADDEWIYPTTEPYLNTKCHN